MQLSLYYLLAENPEFFLKKSAMLVTASAACIGWRPGFCDFCPAHHGETRMRNIGGNKKKAGEDAC